MSHVLRRSRSNRFALWAVVCALVLKAAVPMFAAGAAGMRGVAVAEVCPVYGVALPNATASKHAHHDHGNHGEHAGHAGHAQHEDHSQHEAAAHGGDHCALTALAALALPDLAAPAIAAPRLPPADLTIDFGTAWRDASADWVAGLKHGPPQAQA